jgi:ubiquinone/menaquinone biosynthesis C-methylase UbiE
MQREGWRFPPERRHVLKDEDRRRRLQPERILDEADVQPGETVVDVGAGPGFWTELLAKRVGPHGHVFAVDVEPVMLDELRTLVRERGLSNVDVAQSEETSIPLEEGIADLVLLVFVLHEPPDPMAFLAEIIRLLKPSGRVLVVDWQDWPTEQGPPLEVRISQEEAKALLGAAGLSAEVMTSPTRDAYVLLAREFRAGELEITEPTV